MAYVRSFHTFDQAAIDLNFIDRNLDDVVFEEDANSEYEGVTYRDIILVPQSYRGLDIMSVLGGSNFDLAPDYEIRGGRLEVYAQIILDGDDVLEEWEITGLELSLRDFYEALITRDRADDRALIAEALRGNDRFELSVDADRAFGLNGNDRMFGRGGNDILHGGNGADLVNGGYGNDLLLGQNGNDRLIGGNGRDILQGGAGNDTVLGNAGADRLRMDAGADVLDGGAGIDWLDHVGRTGIRVDLGRTAEQGTNLGRDVVRNIENVNAAAGNDVILGNGTANVLIGNAGNDRLSGRVGNDNLQGGTGNDFLDGGYGADVLAGGGGADRLVGNRGADRMAGGFGEDVFVFRSVQDSRIGAADLVTDFRRGVDVIDLSQIDADTTRQGNQAFELSDLNRFQNGDAGTIIVQQRANETRVILDDDGDGRADMLIRLSGQLDLSESDFIF